MDFTIERMTVADKGAVMAMMRTFYASDAVLSNGSGEIFESDVDHCVGDSPYAEGYVFRQDGRIIGYAMLAKSFSTEFGKPCIWIEDLYLIPECRGKGAGTAFFLHLFADYGDGVVYRLEVEPENATAMALYRKCGLEVLPYCEMIRR